MKALRRSHCLEVLGFAGILAAGPAVAGTNTWTGSSPGVSSVAATSVAADPRDPYVVYGVFANELHRSRDGGRTWTRIATFDAIYSVLVHPASPDTLYVGAAEFEGNGYSNIFKSSDGGATWTRTPTSNSFEGFSVIVGSPTDPGLVYAGSGGRLYRTADGGAHWTQSPDLVGAISSLVIHPHEPSTLYVGTDGDGGYYYPFGAFAESTNTGGNWTYNEDLGVLGHVCVALDGVNPSTLFLGLAADTINAERGVRRSDDGGATWSRAENGLPAGAQVETLAVDPANTATLYAGTRAGIFRSRDSGATWLPFSQVLTGARVDSLVPSPDGRTLLAATDRGAFRFEIAEGPIDVAATGGGASRVLSWSADRLSVQTISGSGDWSASSFEGPVAAWHATAVASSSDGRAHVLWEAGDGRWALEVVGASGPESSVVFAAETGWMPSDVSMGADGRPRLLFTSAGGEMYVAALDASGSPVAGPHYGPTGSWRAIALADAPDGASWVLWRNTDGRSSLSVHRDGVMETKFAWDASSDGAVEDVAVGADGQARILVADSEAHARIWTVGGDGSRSSGPALEMTGLSPRRISGAPDGTIDVMWADLAGNGSIAVVDAAGAVVATHDIPPLP